MRKFTLLMSLIILISCSKSKEEILISDYVQTNGNIKTDLNFKLLKLDKITIIRAIDSIEYFENRIKEEIKGVTQSNIELIKTLTDSGLYDVVKILEDRNDSISKNLFSEKSYLYKIDKKLNEYRQDSLSELALKYKVTYSVINPLLNNVTQTTTKYFYLNTEKVLSDEELKE